MDVEVELRPEGATLLHIVANSEDTKTLKLLLESDRSSIDSLDRHGRSPLSVALQNERFSAARILIEYGADLDLPLSSGCHDNKQSSICLALSSDPKFYEFVESLAENEIPLPFNMSFLLSAAATEGKTELVRSLISFYKVEPNINDELQRTSLHHSCQNGNFELVSLLLQFGADSTAIDSRKSTPLHLSCATGNSRISLALLEGLDAATQARLLGSVDVLGNTPLHMALLNRQFHLSKALIELHRDKFDLTLVNQAGHTVSTLLFVMRFTLSAVPSDLQLLLPCLSVEEATLLLYEGLNQGDVRLMECGIAQGAIVEFFDFMQQTPLLLAAKLGFLDVCKLLISHGANVNTLDFAGKSPLQYASELHHTDIVSLLLATPHIDPSWMFSRFSYALSPDLIRVFVEYFNSQPQATKPRNWLKWLALAAPLADVAAFRSLVESICPDDWVTQLLVETTSKHEDDSVHHKCHSPSVAYSNDVASVPILQLKQCKERRVQASNKLRKSARRKATCFAALKSPPQPSHRWKFAIAKPGKKIPDRVRKWFGRPKIAPHFILVRPKVSHHKHYPLHEAARHGNHEVVEYILSNVHDSRFCAELLTELHDDQRTTVLELVARMPHLLEELEHIQSSTGVYASVEKEFLLPDLAILFLAKLFPLPDKKGFEEVLVHYLLIGNREPVEHTHGGWHHYVEPYWLKCKTPLQKWPLWYLLRRVSTFCETNGVVSLCLNSQEDRETLMSLALKQLNRTTLDQLLCAAVSSSCTWGVNQLLQHGVSLAACDTEGFTPRYALATALHKCHLDIISLLLNKGNVYDFQGRPNLAQLATAVAQGLANRGFTDAVKEVLVAFPTSIFPWYTVRSPRLMYIIAALPGDNSELIESMATDFMSFLCKTVLSWNQLGDEEQHDFKRCLMEFQMYCAALKRATCSNALPVLMKIVVIANKQHNMSELFHSLCGCGYVRMVSLMLDCAGSVTQLANNLDSSGRSPLYYAACGGHVEVIELLMSLPGATALYRPFLPLHGLLLYLIMTMFTHKVSAFDAFVGLNFTNYNYLVAGCKCLVPRQCCLSSAFRSPALVGRMVELLVPLQAPEEWVGELMEPKVINEKCAIDPLLLLASLSWFSVMDRVVKIVSGVWFPQSTRVIGETLALSFFCKKCTNNQPTMLGVAIAFLPQRDRTCASQIFDNILSRCALVAHSDGKLECLKSCTLDLAAKKGYWDFMLAAMPIYSSLLTCENVFHFQAILNKAAKDGQSAYIIALLKDRVIGSSLNLILAMKIGIRYDQHDVVKSLLDHCSIPDLTSAAEVAVNNHRELILTLFMESKYKDDIFTALSIESMIRLAVKCNDSDILSSLHELYLDPELVIGCDFSDRQLSFQFIVLHEASLRGQQELALEAVTCFTETELECQIQNHRNYSDILYWSCFWGVSALLEHLPFTEEQLFKRGKGDVSAWVAGVCNGHMGALSCVPNFPLIPEDITGFLEGSILAHDFFYQYEKLDLATANLLHVLSLGWLNKALLASGDEKALAFAASEAGPSASDDNPLCAQVELCGKTSSISTFLKSSELNNTHLVQAFLTTWGKNAGRVVLLLLRFIKTVGENVMPMLLDVLSLSGLASDKVLLEGVPNCFDLAVHADSLTHSSNCTEVFLRCLSNTSRGRMGVGLDNIMSHFVSHVHHANPSLTRILLDHFGAEAADFCFLLDKKVDYPLYLAYASGNYETAAVLREEARKSSKFMATLSPDWRKEAKRVRGWFRELMKQNESETHHAEASIGQPGFSLRDVSLGKNPAVNLLCSAVSYGNTSVVNAVLASTHPLTVLSQQSVLSDILYDSTVLKCVFSSGSAAVVLGGFNATEVACKAVIRNKSSIVIELLEFSFIHNISLALQPSSDSYSPLSAGSDPELRLELNKVFSLACTHGRQDLVSYLVKSTYSQIRSVLNRHVLQDSLSRALCSGSRDIAAFLALETVCTFDPSFLPCGNFLSPIADIIFSNDRSLDCRYLVQKFFESMSTADRLPFSAQWLVYNWTELQIKLLRHKLGLDEGGSFSASNPWTITVHHENEFHNVTLTIDWESFSEVLSVENPHVQDSSNQVLIPLRIEAIVFSPVVAGRLCCNQRGTKEVFSSSHTDMSFIPTSENLPSSIVLSCVQSPMDPSYIPTFGNQGLLTVCYNHGERIFRFPEIETTHFGEVTTDSGINESYDVQLQLSNESRGNHSPSNRLQSLVDTLTKSVGKSPKCKSVELSDGIYDLVNSDNISILSDLIQMLVKDCAQAIRLAQCRRVFWTELYQLSNHSSITDSESSVRFPRLSKFCFKHFTVSVSIAQDTFTALVLPSVQVTMLGDVLSICVKVVITDPTEIPDLPCFNNLLAGVIECQSQAELAATKVCVKKMLATKFVPLFQMSLKGAIRSLDSVRLTCILESGATCNLIDGEFDEFSDVTILDRLLHLKFFLTLKYFLSHVAALFKVFTLKPRVLSSIRNMFASGHRIVVGNCSSTGFVLRAGMPQLMLRTSDFTRSFGNHRKLLFSVFSSIVTLKAHAMSTDFLSTIPTPFGSFIDWEKSSGFLYPRLGRKSTLTVQLVNYCGHKLTSSPTVPCHLTASVKAPNGAILTAELSDDPKPDTACKDFVIRQGNEGTLVIEWVPKCIGIQKMRVALNRMPLGGSPFKVFIPTDGSLYNPDTGYVGEGSDGARVTTVGTPLVVVAAHPSCSCSHGSTDSPPELIIPGRQSVRDYVEKSRNKVGPSSQSCSPDAIVESEYLKEGKSLHFISAQMSSGSDSSCSWERLTSILVPSDSEDCYSSELAVYVTQFPQKEKTTRKSNGSVWYTPLGNRQYRLSLFSTTASTYKIFVACSSCHAVMKLLWKEDGTSLLPALCYFLPGPFSPLTSSLSLSSKKAKTQSNPTFKAGSIAIFYLHAHDLYGNKHTAAGAIKEASIISAGMRIGSPQFTGTGELIRERLNQPALCTTEHIGEGIYRLQTTVYSAGIHPVRITNHTGVSGTLGRVEVECGPAFQPNCLLGPGIPTTAILYKKFQILLHLFDEYCNPCSPDRSVRARVDSGERVSITHSSNAAKNCMAIAFVPSLLGKKEVFVYVNNSLVNGRTIQVDVVRPILQNFEAKVQELKLYIKTHYREGYTPTITIDRGNILESAVNSLPENYFNFVVRVRFGDECGIDDGGLAREFFYLLTQEFVNPNYALCQCVSGLFRPSPNSSVNSNHLFYFNFFGKILAKAICDGHQVLVRFTPAVYKYLLQMKCTLDDLKIEDHSLHGGIIGILNSESQEELDELAVDFTASHSHFGSVETVELEHGGEGKMVTMQNRTEFVDKMCSWHLTGCIEQQLQSIKTGFHSLLPMKQIGIFSPHELEVLLSGQPTIDVKSIRTRTTYRDYSPNANIVKWLWEILERYSEEEKCRFLQFTTGCACLPSPGAGAWEMRISKGNDPSLLPLASTCSNTLILPLYSSSDVLKQKLDTAIAYGQQGFLLY